MVAESGDPVGWASAHRGELLARVEADGYLHVSGLGIAAPAEIASVRTALGHSAAVCRELFAPRRAFGDGVYAWPEWAGDREMCLHHEQGGGVDFPGLLLMAYLEPAQTGGAILLGDTAAVLAHLPAELRTRFTDQGWLLTRTFRQYLGLGWAVAFDATTPAEVEAACAARLIGTEWLRDGSLRTQQRRAAVVHHPRSGAACWFNDIAFFSGWSVAATERDVLLAAFGPDGLPFSTGFGDAGPLTEEQYDELMAAYDNVLMRVDWQPGDLLLVDNIRTAHGREPFTGGWEVAVGLADPVDLRQCAPAVPPLAGPAN